MIGAPSIFKLTRIAAALARLLPTFALSCVKHEAEVFFLLSFSFFVSRQGGKRHWLGTHATGGRKLKQRGFCKSSACVVHFPVLTAGVRCIRNVLHLHRFLFPMQANKEERT